MSSSNITFLENKKNTSFDQENIFDFKKTDFKELDINIYTLKITSKSRNVIKEPSPFSFEIGFNNTEKNSAVIPSKFENIRKIQIAQILIPRFIPRDYIGEPVNGVTPILFSAHSISLSFYPGINLNNTTINALDSSGNQFQIEVIELVDLNLKRVYLVALQYNNPYHIGTYINIKAELFSYVNINNNVYPITQILGSQITLDTACTIYNPLPNFTNQRLIIADFYKNNIITVNKSAVTTPLLTTMPIIGFNTTTINIYKVNYTNFQYLFPDQYLEFQVNTDLYTILEKKLFKVKSVVKDRINKYIVEPSVSNTVIIITGVWVGGISSIYNSINPLTFTFDYLVKINQFNFGSRDLLDEKIFYCNFYPFVPNKRVSTDIEVNDSFGVFFPATQSKDYLFLRGDAFELYNLNNLKTTNSKINFSLLDSNFEDVGAVFKKYPIFYQPNLFSSVKSYLQNIPDVTIIVKIEEIERKNVTIPFSLK